MPNPSILDTASIPEFFRGKVSEAIQEVNVTVSPHAEFYLVNLLTFFTKAKNLFEKDENGEIVDQALALRLFDALLATPGEKIPILKKMGDIALYTSGFFADSLFKKIVGVNYYIKMGHTAYSSLSHLVDFKQGKDFKELFGELAHNFINFVNVLSHVSDSTHLNTAQDLLKLYERWLATGSKQVQQLLSQQGIITDEHLQIKDPH